MFFFLCGWKQGTRAYTMQCDKWAPTNSDLSNHQKKLEPTTPEVCQHQEGVENQIEFNQRLKMQKQRRTDSNINMSKCMGPT